LVRPTATFHECPDPDDNRVLECAFDGKADYVVTGDWHLLDMKRFRRIEILKVATFLKLFGK
jgi:hypothetical protein